MHIENFKQAYAIARNNRHHRLWVGEFIRFPGGSVYIGPAGVLVIDRDNRGISPSFFNTVGLRIHSKAFRRLRCANSRAYGPVPLP